MVPPVCIYFHLHSYNNVFLQRALHHSLFLIHIHINIHTGVVLHETSVLPDHAQEETMHIKVMQKELHRLQTEVQFITYYDV